MSTIYRYRVVPGISFVKDGTAKNWKMATQTTRPYLEVHERFGGKAPGIFSEITVAGNHNINNAQLFLFRGLCWVPYLRRSFVPTCCREAETTFFRLCMMSSRYEHTRTPGRRKIGRFYHYPRHAPRPSISHARAFPLSIL